MSNRRAIREAVLQALYAEDLSNDSWEHILESQIKSKFSSDTDSRSFAEKLFLKTLKNREEIDAVISNHTKNWDMGRLNLVDKQILRLALCEFLFFEQIPTKVTINEAIEIAKKFSTAKSGNFVNGILDAALEQLKEEDRINKKGRGLIESSINQ